MPFVRHGRHFIGNRHAAPVLLVVHWLRRATQRFVSGRDKYTVPAAAREAMCTHLRRIIYGHLPEICNSVQWRTHTAPYKRELWTLIDDNVLVAWSRSQGVKYSSPTPTLQQLIERRHQMLASAACARLVQVTAQELFSELFQYSV
jgi:hypothetical protein